MGRRRPRDDAARETIARREPGPSRMTIGPEAADYGMFTFLQLLLYPWQHHPGWSRKYLRPITVIVTSFVGGVLVLVALVGTLPSVDGAA
ncbi:hypothetical protein Pme01_34800 [Planosporangium mesophilum]|uniref:Uncharacterized protein n=1 Tax=Planosporangium mesophilum TaxID=689768 RepID=A0A8J3X4K2_9ACTN|nr:hypothetical protein Pme01_34800 [Planosporangium mesophilum]